MEISLNYYSVPLLFGFVNGLIFAILLFFRGRRQERLSDYFLGSLLVLSCIYVLPYMLGFMNIQVMWEELDFFPTSPGLLFGPFMYGYLISQTNHNFKLSKKDLWHLLPFAVYFIYHLIAFLRGPEFVDWWKATYDLPYIDPVIQLATLIFNYYYLYLSFRHYKSYRKWIEINYSNTDSIRFTWFRNYLYLIAFSITLSWTFTALGTFGVDMGYSDRWWEYLIVAILMYYLAIAGYTQVQKTFLFFNKEEEQKIEERELEGDNKPTLDEEEVKRWKTKIQAMLNEDKVFLIPDLSLSELAKRMKTNTGMLSQYINFGFDKNFKQLINDYRIEEFKQEVIKEENNHMTLLAIAFNSGFNSKATFNRVFKKSTGLSPREYMEQQSAA